MPTILLNIITDTIAPHPDLDIVGKRGRSGRLLDAAEQTHADVIIVTRQGSGSGEDYDEILHRHARLKVIEIFDDGRRGLLHELQSHRIPLGEMSPPRLVDVIRDAASSIAGAKS
jgi:chemotaxis response regulator CheB